MAENNGSTGAAISLPKGGGSIKGIGETFQPNLFTGTGNFSIPIYTSPGRNNFGPKLSLQYSSGNGNGIFGLGWQLSIPRISRKTEKGLPKYTDEDVFVLSGAEDLVPCLGDDGEMLQVDNQRDYKITRFRPRTEGLFARIEKWTHTQDHNNTFWRVVTRENVTSIYGRKEHARLIDRDNPIHIYEWLLEETFDARGNHIYYEYIKDDPDLLINKIYEQNRTYNQVYIRRILYGNVPDDLADEKKNVCPLISTTDHADILNTRDRRYLFEVLFDYGDIPDKDNLKNGFSFKDHLEKSLPAETLREDPFSGFRAGFEIRTLRKCHRVLMLHHFIEGELIDAPLVKSTDFTYTINKEAQFSMLTDVQVVGYRKDPDDNTKYLNRNMPPVSFKYSELKPQEQHYQSVKAEGNDLPPASLNNPNYSLIDLFGDGLPDILNTENTGYYYWQNKGDGLLDRRHPQHVHSPLPAGVTIGQQNVAIGDMGGDGLPDLIVESSTMSGFYEATPDGKWKNFKKFNTLPSFGLSNPNARLVDLTGDGLSDILLTTENSFLWFPCLGEKGFDNPIAVPRQHDLDEFPDVFFNDPSNRVRLADMTGDGINDIVMVHDGNISYWPNLGYGKFGKRMRMENAPKIAYDFNPKRLFLSDIDGNGCADLVYIDTNEVHFWFNQSGNGWSEKQTIHGTPAITDLSSIQFADFFGTGTACIIWSYNYNLQPDGNYKVLDFCGKKKPHLLVEMSNNMGATTRAQYAPSTKFYLEDKKAGNPWATHLPFPVQVLEKTEVIDHISKTKLVTTYKYHHGYYDGKEREFRGFGRVDQYDTEVFQDFSERNLHGENIDIQNKNKAYHVPPVLTKNWFHTGVYFDEDKPTENGSFFDHHHLMNVYKKEFYQGDDKAFKMRDQVFEQAQGSSVNDTPHEMFRALRGSLLRSEVYAVDDSDKSAHPYTVTQNRFNVKELQVKGENNHAVFLTTQAESISYHYERNPTDPRVGQEITIKIDEYGNITDQVSIGYPRRNVPAEMPEQGELKTLYTKTDFINKSDDTGFYYSCIPYQSMAFEVTGIDWNWSMPPLASNDFEQVIKNTRFKGYDWVRPVHHTAIEKRLLEWSRSYFRNDNHPNRIDPVGILNHRLRLGEIESLGLPYESYTAAFTNGMIRSAYRNKIPISDRDNMMEKAGYVYENNMWWIPSGKQSFNEDRFYNSEETRDPFDNPSYIIFDDYALLTKAAIDAVDNEIVAENDYRVLQPFKIKDPNDNYSQVALDALGMVVGTAVWGEDIASGPVGDSLNGFISDLDLTTVIRRHLDDPLNHDRAYNTDPHNILQNATTRLVYDFKRYQDLGEPNVVYTLVRETHVNKERELGITTKIQHSFLYSDGFERELQRKVQAEPGPIYNAKGNVVLSNADPRWIGTGSKVYNNKGKSVQEYEPFFSETPYFGIERHGISPTLFYDPLERVICTILPNNSYEKVVFDPWKQETWDANDTALLIPDIDNDVSSYIAEYITCLSSAYKTWYDQRISDRNNKPNINSPNTPPEQIAALKAEAHANTPSLFHFDTLGRPFLTISHNKVDCPGHNLHGTEDWFRTWVEMDIEGNQRIIIDERTEQGSPIKEKRIVMQYDYNIAGPEKDENGEPTNTNLIHQASMDAGERWLLNDVTGNPIYTWDSRGHCFRTEYDPLRRPLCIYVTGADHSNPNVEFLTERLVYGEQHPEAKSRNLCTRPFLHLDQAGAVLTDINDFKGNPLVTSRRITKGIQYRKVVNWRHVNDNHNILPTNATSKIKLVILETALTPLLETGLSSNTKYDALNRPFSVTSPDNSVYRSTYNEANLLEKVDVNLRGEQEINQPKWTPFVVNINYNAKGQRELVEYGCGVGSNLKGVFTKYTYDKDTFRLIHLKTTRPSGLNGGVSKIFNDPEIIQDLHYTYDPVGNITRIEDTALKTINRSNQIIEPVCIYTYDSLYRLIEAKGREHIGQNDYNYTPQDKNFRDYPFNKQQAHPNDLFGLRNYTEKYEYDEVGNFNFLRHTVGGVTRTRNYKYQIDSIIEAGKKSNRLTSSTVGNEPGSPQPFRCDDHGNMKNMDHLTDMIWDYKDQLQQVDLGGGGLAYYVYDAVGQRVRKVIESQNGTLQKERIYIGGYELYREYNGSLINMERESYHVMDNKQRIAFVATQTIKDGKRVTKPVPLQRYQMGNHLGSSTVELDKNGNLITYEEYHPFGTSSFQTMRSGAEVSLKRYRYTSKERDDETGLYYYGARYYAPWLGRWISCDPAGIADGINLYIFTRNNPIFFIDPTGFDSDGGPQNEVEPGIRTNLNSFDPESPPNGGAPTPADIERSQNDEFASNYTLGSFLLKLNLDILKNSKNRSELIREAWNKAEKEGYDINSIENLLSFYNDFTGSHIAHRATIFITAAASHKNQGNWGRHIWFTSLGVLDTIGSLIVGESNAETAFNISVGILVGATLRGLQTWAATSSSSVASSEARLMLAFKPGVPSHLAVGVTLGESTVWSDLVINSVRSRIPLPFKNGITLTGESLIRGPMSSLGKGPYLISSRSITGRQGIAIWRNMLSRVGDTGQYHYLSSNCATYASELTGTYLPSPVLGYFLFANPLGAEAAAIGTASLVGH